MTGALTGLATGLMRCLDPEQAHSLAIAALKTFPLPRPVADDPILATSLAGLSLSNPVGLAAGLDKNAEALAGLSRLGFGFVECGSVTPYPQDGNPRPRLFRLNEDRAIINRMGFNNQGLEAFAAHLDRRPKNTVVGANLGANKETRDHAADYVTGVNRLKGLCSYFTINISSPNTPGLRALQGRAALDDLLGRIDDARSGDATPVFLKIAPDLSETEITLIVEAARHHRIEALIVSNTTLDRPESLKSRWASESGGLSGEPLAETARRALHHTVAAAGPDLSVIAVGGIGTGAEAYARIRAGACAVQIYSGLIYEGPGLVAAIKRDLAARLRAEGFSTIYEASTVPR